MSHAQTTTPTFTLPQAIGPQSSVMPCLVTLSVRVTDGLAICAELADEVLHDSGELAMARRIPTRRLELALADLVRSGILISKRGRAGGYILSRPPSSIRLQELFTALGNEPLPAGPWNDKSRPLHMLNHKLNAAIWRTLESMTLADFVAMGQTS